jgi:hypothetical protein
MTRVLPGVIVAPGVGNGVVPGGMASAGELVGLGLSVGVGLGLELGGGSAAGVHAASRRAARTANTVRRILRWCDIWQSQRSPGRRLQ